MFSLFSHWVFFLVALFCLQHHPALCTIFAGSVAISDLSLLCGTSVLCTRSDPPVIPLTPLPGIHTAIYSRPPSNNSMHLLTSPSGNTHNLLQVSLASAVSLATSAILALCGSDPDPLRTPHSLVATFAPSNLHTLGSSRTLGNKYLFCPLGSRRCSNDSASCCSL